MPLSAGLASLEGTLGRRWEKERRGKKKKKKEKGKVVRKAGTQEETEKRKKSQGFHWGSNPGPPA